MNETAAAWASEFTESAAYRELPQPAKEYAEEILPVFLSHACGVRGVAPGDVYEHRCLANRKPAAP